MTSWHTFESAAGGRRPVGIIIRLEGRPERLQGRAGGRSRAAAAAAAAAGGHDGSVCRWRLLRLSLSRRCCTGERRGRLRVFLRPSVTRSRRWVEGREGVSEWQVLVGYISCRTTAHT